VSQLDASPVAPRALTKRLGLCAFVYAYRALFGLLVALPATVAVGAVAAQYPRGQAELFDPGGIMLVEGLRLLRRGGGAAAYAALSLALVAVLLGVLVLGALVAGLGREGRLSPGFLADRAIQHARTLALLFVLGLIAQGLVGAILGMIGGRVVGALDLSPRREDLATGAVALVVLGAVAAVGVVRDLASVAAVHGGHRFYVATSRALRAMRRAGGRAVLAWSWRSALAFGGIALATRIAPPLAGAGAGAVLIGVLLHQAGIAGTVLARASWLAAAIRLYEATAPVEAAAVPEATLAPEAAIAPVPEPAASAPEAPAASEPESAPEPPEPAATPEPAPQEEAPAGADPPTAAE
jgi:hypothetical protein